MIPRARASDDGASGGARWSCAVTRTISWVQAPFLALQFLTIMPPLVRREPRIADLGRSVAFFPLIGLLIGVLLVGADMLLEGVVAPLVRDIALVAILAAVTGALHLDGVVDTFDGLFAGSDRERRLEVMRDPRAGSFGVVAVALVLFLKFAAVTSLATSTRWSALLLAPCLGRWAMVLVMSAYPYARAQGMGTAFKHSIRPAHVALAGAFTLAVAGLTLGVAGLAVAAAVSVAALISGHWITGRLGGLTGDTYGALCELIETGVLIALGLRLGVGLP